MNEQKSPAVGGQVDGAVRPAAWVRDLGPQPHCVTDLRYCAAGDVERGEQLQYLPLYDQAALDAAVAAARERWQREPVAAQCRFPGVAWSQCDVAHARMVMANPSEWPTYQVRLLCEWVGPNVELSGPPR